MTKTFKIMCRPCLVCGKAELLEIEATDDQLDDFQEGLKNIQTIFPEVPADIREMLISGTHPECWHHMMDEEAGNW